MGDSSRNDTLTFEAEVLFVTEAAVRVEIDGEEVWLPKSKIDWEESALDEDGVSIGDRGQLGIPRWLAEDRGLA